MVPPLAPQKLTNGKLVVHIFAPSNPPRDPVLDARPPTMMMTPSAVRRYSVFESVDVGACFVVSFH